MALMPCKECGHEVSDKAEKCPGCGVSFPAIKDAEERIGFAKGRIIAGFLFFGGLLWLVFSYQTLGKDGLVSAWNFGAGYMMGAGVFWYFVSEIARNLHERNAKRMGRH